MDIVSLWKKTLQLIKGEVASASFETFFKNTVPIETDSNELTLLAPNEFAEDILRTSIFKFDRKLFESANIK